MIAPSELQCYLQKICRRYEHWWAVDALTETIADRQATFSFEQMVQTEEKKPGEKPQIVSLSILKGIQDYVESEHILLVGSPGVGKSTALLRCLVSFAKEELGKPESRIPVLVPLKRYNVRFSSSEDPSGMLTLIRDALKPQLRLKIPEVEELLFQKRLILLLDGLNEMPADTVRTQLKAFREECYEIPLICTTRDLGSGDLGIKRRLEVQPPSPLEINRFLRECMPAQAQQVLQLLSRDNRELSRTPFVLWMLYQLFQETGAVVETLGEAFRQFFRSFKKYKEDAPVTDERRKAWNPWLEHLAFTMLDSPEPNDPGLVLSDERAEKVLAEKFGDLHGASSRIEELLKYHLLERVSDREVSFHHQLIQEYYAAERLLPKLAQLSDDELKYYYLNYLKWTEPLAMAMTFVDSPDLVVRVVKLALEVDLYLGARLAGEVKPEFQKRTIDLVISECEQRKLPPLIKVTCLHQSRSIYSIQSLVEALNEPNADTQEKALQALEEIADATVLPNLLQVIENPDGRSYPLVMDVIDLLVSLDSKNTTLPKLLELLKSQYPGLRKIAALALGRFNTRECIPDLVQALNDPTIRVRRAVISSLGEMGYQEIIPDLLKMLDRQGEEYDERMFSTAAFALAKLDFEQAFSHPDAEVRGAAISLLEKQNLEIVLPRLKAALKDTNFDVRRSAILMAGQVKAKEFVEDIFQALEDPDITVQMEAASALGQICSVEIIPELLKKLKTQESRTRRSVVDTMRNLDSEQAVPGLFQALVDSDQSVRRNALYALGQLCRKTAIPYFIEILLDPKNEDYNILLNNYLQKLEPRRKSELLEQTNSQDTHIRWEAVKTLARVASHAAIPDLIKDFSKAKNVGHRWRLIDSLKSTANEQILPTLLDALNEQEVAIRRHAAFAIRDIGSCLHLPYLWQQQSRNPLEAIGTAIAAIQSRCQFYNYDIAQSPPPAVRETAGFNLSTLGVTIMTDKQPIVNFNQPNSTIGINYAAEGSNVKFQQNVKNVTEQDRAELQALLIQLAQTYPITTEPQKQTFIQKFLERIESTPGLVKVLLAGSIEGLKILCPPAGIPIEMSRRLYQAVQERHSQP